MRGEVIAAVVCTGQSVTQEDVDYLRGKCKVVAVSDAYKIAPWADAMAAHDSKWWDANYDCDFAGPRFIGGAGSARKAGATVVTPSGGNSGCLGIYVANKLFRPSKILLLGADLHGTHYFGPHTKPRLHNTSKEQFDVIRKQYLELSHLPVINCSPISKLKCFPKAKLREILK